MTFWSELHTQIDRYLAIPITNPDVLDARRALSFASRAEENGAHAEADKQLAFARTALDKIEAVLNHETDAPLDGIEVPDSAIPR